MSDTEETPVVETETQANDSTQETERLEAEKKEEEDRLEAERLEAEKKEQERAEAERLEAEKIEQERLEAERIEAENREAERMEAERLEAERKEQERIEAERLEAEKKEQARLEAERKEQERIEAERLEAEKKEAEKKEQERLEEERKEQERIEAEKKEAERIEAEKREAEKIEQERIEAEKKEAEKKEQERLEAEKKEAERIEAEKKEAEEKEQERIEAENKEQERIENEKKEKEKREQERINKEKEAKEAEKQKTEEITVEKETNSLSSTKSLITRKMVKLAVKTSDERVEVDVKDQTVDIGDGVRRKSGQSDALISKRFVDIATMYDSFKEIFGTRSFEKGKWGDYKWVTYDHVAKRVKNLASGLIFNGLEVQSHVGIYSKNRIEWHLASEACNKQSMVTISLYDTLGPESSEYIMNHAEISCICCSGETLKPLLKIAPKCEFLKLVVCFDPIEDENDKKEISTFEGKISFRYIKDVEEDGAKNLVADVPPKPETLAIIMGVMITHENVIASVTGITHNLPAVGQDDSYLSYLPLAHILARVAETAMIQFGVRIGFFHGVIPEITEDILALKPSILVAVPRVLDKIYARIQGRIESAGAVKKYLFHKAVESAKYYKERSQKGWAFWDYLVFGTVKGRVGGRVRCVLSGGAPLRPEVGEFLSVCLGCPVIQGYGLTETTSAGTLQLHTDDSSGIVGPPVACCEIKLIDVPDMDYKASENGGEVLIRGPSISLGYYKEPEKTAESFDDEGFFHTGDIGRWNKNGTLSIIDRKKNIFKLSQGEYVAAEHIENQLAQGKYLSKIFVYGDSLKDSLVCIGVVEPEIFLKLAQEKKVEKAQEANLGELCKNPTLLKVVLDDIQAVGKSLKLKSYEIPKQIFLTEKEFDTVDGLTPTMKLKRNVLQKVFQKEIDEMYQKIEQK